MTDYSVYCPHGPHRFRIGMTGDLADLRLVYKDLYDVQGYRTGAGNPAWLRTHTPATGTAPVLQQLLDAGISVVGRVQTDELAYSLNGQNCHYGTPVNPKTPTRIPGGSSSGCAVAVASGDADVGLGTDTGGSIRVPACYNGLYGIRPTHGRLSLAHVVPLAPCFDTAGWLCRDAYSLARVGQILFQEAPAVLPEYSSFLWAEALFAMLPDAIQPRLDHIRHTLSDHGHSVMAAVLSPERLTGLGSAFRILQGREIARTHQMWVADHLNDLGSDIAERFRWALQLTAAEESDAAWVQSQWCEAISALLDGRFLLIPTIPAGAPLLTASGLELAAFRERLMGLTALAGLAGLPQIQLPVLELEGVPLGLSLVGARGTDMQLLAMTCFLSEVLVHG